MADEGFHQLDSFELDTGGILLYIMPYILIHKRQVDQ